MSTRTETPPPFRPPTILDAVSTPSHEHRRLYLEHVEDEAARHDREERARHRVHHDGSEVCEEFALAHRKARFEDQRRQQSVVDDVVDERRRRDVHRPAVDVVDGGHARPVDCGDRRAEQHERGHLGEQRDAARVQRVLKEDRRQHDRRAEREVGGGVAVLDLAIMPLPRPAGRRRGRRWRRMRRR